MRKILFLLDSGLLLLLLMCVNCLSFDIKPEKELPPATQEGKNTIGFLVDSEVWVPKHSFSFPAMNGFYESGSLYLRANRGNKTQFGIDHGYITGLGTFPLTASDSAKLINAFFYIDGKGRYTTSFTSDGELNITKLDTLQKIISGTFYFDAINEEGEIVEIRDGRFDLKY